MKRLPLFAGCVGVVATGLAISGVGRHKPPPAPQSIVVVPAPPTTLAVRARAPAEAMPDVPQLPPPPFSDNGSGGEDPPAHWAPGAKNYADLGVLPAL